jgi:cytochrome b6-f complex iron-sulfur subunit
MNYSRKRKKQIKRREFLGLAWAVALLGLFGQAGIGLFKFFKPTIEPGSFGGLVVAGQLEEFQPGTVSHVREGRFYISRLEDGGMMALWQRCPHLGCTIPWRESVDEFLCPCHSSIFNTVGEVVSGPSPRPMDMFPIEILEGQVVVDTGLVIERQDFEASQVYYPS